MNQDVQNTIIRYLLTLLFVKGFLSLPEYLIMRDFVITNLSFKL